MWQPGQFVLSFWYSWSCIFLHLSRGGTRYFWWMCGSVLQSLTLFQTKIWNFLVPFLRPRLKNSYPFSDLVSRIHTRFQTFTPIWLKSIPYFRPKRLNLSHTLWWRAYLYSYSGVHPPPPSLPSAWQIWESGRIDPSQSQVITVLIDQVTVWPGQMNPTSESGNILDETLFYDGQTIQHNPINNPSCIVTLH